MAEQLFASFILDRDQGLEIAIAAENVTEATSLTEKIQTLPASVPFLEGIMHLRDEVIPVLNLKKRLGLKESAYDQDAKIAVILLADQRFGLLFDDIREVLRVDDSLLLPIQPALQSEDYVISNLITLKTEHRTLEVLDLDRLFPGASLLLDNQAVVSSEKQNVIAYTYSRYVIFISDNQEYGIPVENSREITFPADIDATFHSGCLEGALQLRGNTIPVMSAGSLLKGICRERDDNDELSRILIMSTDALTFGIVIDEIREILTVANEKILSMPCREDQSVAGIYEPTPGRNIMLLEVTNLIAGQVERLESMSRIQPEDKDEEDAVVAEARHLITENCYLIFSIGKHFAIELKDVQEILERNELMAIPAATGFDSDVINLRGAIIPVVNLRKFYGYPVQNEPSEHSRLIICCNNNYTIALQVDTIITIYKQEQFHPTPSLNPQLQPKKDTLNHLIEFIGEQGVKEHVLVVNSHALAQNHLQQDIPTAEPSIENSSNEDTIDSLTDFKKGEK
jgi:purine-binding chemotaxis protein CheW